MTRKVLPILVAVGLLLRVAVVVCFDLQYEFPDSASYRSVASSLLGGRGLMTEDGARVKVAPLYPLFLAAGFSAFGGRELPVRILQAAIGSLLCLPAFLLVKRLWGEQPGWLAAAFVTLEPSIVFSSTLLLAEGLFTLTLVVAVLYFAVLLDDARSSTGVAAGAVSGLALLLRPSVLLLIPVLVAAVILYRRGRGWVSCGVAPLLAAAVVAAPWVARNYSVTGRVVVSPLIVGRTLYEANCPEATGGPLFERFRWPSELQGMTEYERDRRLWSLAIRYIREHPARSTQLALSKFIRTWSPIPNFESFRTPLIITVSAMSYVPAVLLACWGAWENRRAWRRWVLVALPILYFAAVHCVFVGSIRYRQPAMPFILVFSAVGLWSLVAKLARHGRAASAAPGRTAGTV